MMEGDATLYETQSSSFGRGRQPRFTLEYRAMGNITNKYRNSDKFFCGSYREFIPDHYQMGYQMVLYGNQLAGRQMANEMAAFGPRHPWNIIEGLRMKKLFGFSSKQLFNKTFDHLTDFWAEQPLPQNSSQTLPTPRIKSYTTYKHPQSIADKGILLLKEDLDKPSRFVLLDEQTGHERRLCYTGDVSTRPIYDAANQRVWWTEYRRSTMFQERVRSTLCYMDIEKGRPRSIRNRNNILYPTPDDTNGLAWIEYNHNGIYSFHYRRHDGAEQDVELSFGQEIHSLAWDNLTRTCYCIITGDEGMWIAEIDSKYNIRPLTRPAYITLSNLRASD
jgi:hypothetical protein